MKEGGDLGCIRRWKARPSQPCIEKKMCIRLNSSAQRSSSSECKGTVATGSVKRVRSWHSVAGVHATQPVSSVALLSTWTYRDVSPAQN